MKFLLSPGYTNSGPDHWQTHLHSSYESFERVQHSKWDYVEREPWIQELEQAMSTLDEELILIGHSCGANVIAQWSHTASPHLPKVKAAILVAPANVDDSSLPPEITAQSPLPYKRLPFPALVIGSDNDPYISQEDLENLAQAWGAELVVVPGAGHLASADGYGAWPEIVTHIEKIAGLTLRPLKDEHSYRQG
ncbi:MULTISPECIES: RBBP9/YdeN family alpha/beta hydrolase [Rothia]|uniref:Alpha/beta hydrolase n=1 Tax=Rothia nasimurium TaxID=85336 RepID=A0A1Y1RN60_9MICC|nr:MULTISPECIES: alpha/beta hydrolase [Rothia]ORC16023.1 hypothetical protein A7979_05260 [Rothia nasimurium]